MQELQEYRDALIGRTLKIHNGISYWTTEINTVDLIQVREPMTNCWIPIIVINGIKPTGLLVDRNTAYLASTVELLINKSDNKVVMSEFTIAPYGETCTTQSYIQLL